MEVDFRPGVTRNVTGTDAWTRLSSLLPELIEAEEKADGFMVSVATNAAEIAYGSQQPSVSGHALAVGDFYSYQSRAAASLAWFRNAAAGSNAVLVVTPIYAL